MQPPQPPRNPLQGRLFRTVSPRWPLPLVCQPPPRKREMEPVNSVLAFAYLYPCSRLASRRCRRILFDTKVFVFDTRRRRRQHGSERVSGHEDQCAVGGELSTRSEGKTAEVLHGVKLGRRGTSICQSTRPQVPFASRDPFTLLSAYKPLSLSTCVQKIIQVG